MYQFPEFCLFAKLSISISPAVCLLVFCLFVLVGCCWFVPQVHVTAFLLKFYFLRSTIFSHYNSRCCLQPISQHLNCLRTWRRPDLASEALGLITWRISAQAEILARIAGLKFPPGFWNKSSKNSNWRLRGEGFSSGWKVRKNPMESKRNFSSGWKASLDMRSDFVSWETIFQPGLKFALK